MSEHLLNVIPALWVAFVFLFGTWWGERYERKRWQGECVVRGLAHWKVSADGSTEFVWGKGEK